MAAVYVDHVKCKVRSLRYDFDRRTGKLNLPPRTVADMQGAVELFERIDPRVEWIKVMVEGEADRLFRKDERGWFTINLSSERAREATT